MEEIKQIFAEAPRLRLRTFQARDVARLAALLGMWEIARRLVSIPYPYEEKDAASFLAHVQGHYAAGKPEFFLIADKETDEVMGGIGFHSAKNIDKENGMLEVGYWLGHPYWGKGFMGEALAAGLEVMWGRGETEIGALTDPNNTASNRLLEKAGFMRVGEFDRETPRRDGGVKTVQWVCKKV